MNPLQKCNAHTPLQFYRRRCNRFGENRLTDACRAVFPKQAAPKSHAFFSCHEPLLPDTRCGELHGGLSSREHGSAGFAIQRNFVSRSGRLQITPKHSQPRRVGLPDPKPARSTEFPLGAIEPTKPPTGMKWRLSIFEVALA